LKVSAKENSARHWYAVLSVFWYRVSTFHFKY